MLENQMAFSQNSSQSINHIFGPQKVTSFSGAFGKELPRVHFLNSIFDHSLHQLTYSDLSLFFTTYSHVNLSVVPAAQNCILFTGRPFGLDDSLIGSSNAADICKRFFQIDGKFSCLTYQNNQLIIASDMIGAGSLYYTFYQETLFFSTHLGLLLDILPFRPQVNRVGVASILLSLSQLFEETHFSNIFRLDAGSLIIASFDRNSKAVDFKKIQYISYKDLINQSNAESATPEQFNILLSESLQREHYTAKAAIMLSDGLDSRAIALNRPSQVNTAITYGTKDSYDLFGAREIAKKLGMQHYSCPYEEWTLETYAEQIIGLHAGCTGLQTSHAIVGYDWAQKAKIADTAIVGLLGNTLTGDFLGLENDLELREEQVLNTLVGNKNNELIEKYFREEIGFICDEILNRWKNLKKEISPVQSFTMLTLYYRQARRVSMLFDLGEWFTEISYPLFNRDLIQMFFNARESDLAAQSLYKRAIEIRSNEMGLRRNLSDKVYSKIFRTYFSLIQGRMTVSKVYWHEVLQRTQINVKQYECGYRDLDLILKESWQQALESKSTAFGWPFFCTIVPLTAACKKAAT